MWVERLIEEGNGYHIRVACITWIFYAVLLSIFVLARSFVKSMETIIVEKMQPFIMSHVDIIVATANIYWLQNNESLIAYSAQNSCLHSISKNGRVLPTKTVQFFGHVVAVYVFVVEEVNLSFQVLLELIIIGLIKQ